MRIVCLGAASDYIAIADKSYATTSGTSQKMVDFFNAQGGDTPLKSAPVAKAPEGNIFDKAWGIFEKLGTLASSKPAPKPVAVSASTPPLGAVLGIGIVGLILLKAAKG